MTTWTRAALGTVVAVGALWLWAGLAPAARRQPVTRAWWL